MLYLSASNRRDKGGNNVGNKPKTLDATGWAIVEELQKNARKPLKEIAKAVNLSAPSLTERIRKMEADGIIEGYKAIVNPQKVGYHFRAILALKTKYEWPEKYLNEKLKNMPEIINYWSVTGDVEVYIEVLLVSMKHLKSVLKTLSEHGRITTSVVISCCKHNGKNISRFDDDLNLDDGEDHEFSAHDLS